MATSRKTNPPTQRSRPHPPKKRSRSRQFFITRKVQSYIAVARSANTVRAYCSDLAHFLAWGGHLPARPQTVAEYLADHAETHAYATLVRRIAALKLAHRERRLPNPCDSELVRSTLRGIRRAKPPTTRRVKPLLGAQIVKVVRRAKTLREKRDKAVLLLGFAGAFRSSELVALNVEDLGMAGERLAVTIRSSKTDQMKLGRQVMIPAARGTVCPIRAVRDWLESAGITAGPVFRRIDRHGNIGAEGVGWGIVSVVVRSAAAKLGLDTREFSGHSLRAGYVTTAALKGMPNWLIKEQTGHKSDAVLETYIRPIGLQHTVRLL
jgi:integrase